MPACGEAGDGVGIVWRLQAWLWLSGWVVRVSREGGRAGRISSLRRWLLG